MHELALAEAIVAVTEEAAAGRPVAVVELKVGHLRQVVPGALELAFRLVGEGTVAERAELAIDVVPGRVACRECGGESGVAGFPLACAACGAFDVDIVAGEELEVDALELYDKVEARAIKPLTAGRR